MRHAMQPGRHRCGHLLGEAGLYWDGQNHQPIATEGGHGDLAPHDELEMDLLRFLIKQHGRISWERLVSGPGLVNIYRFFKETGREEEEGWLAD
jgi:glucokinase